MAKRDKQQTVETLRERLSQAKGTFFADFQGMDVAAASQLRTKCREAGVQFQVVKNTLARRALDESLRSTLDTALTGPTAVATSVEDEVIAAKVISDFCKEFERPVLKAGIVDGKAMNQDQVNVLAMLPSREVLLGRFAAGLKSPVQKLHAALSSPLTKLAMALKQVADQKA
jgi:large subunit ribosomal protein L10